MGNTGIEVGKVEKQKRVYEISLMLRRKPMPFILEFIRENWGVKTDQAYNYIKDARVEWGRYFTNVNKAGLSYHLTQLRELKDIAWEKEDIRLMFDIAKEEAKLCGAYPAEKHKIEDEKKIIVIGAEEGRDARAKLTEKIEAIAKRNEGEESNGDKEKEMENWSDEQWLVYIEKIQSRKEERERKEVNDG